MFRLVGPVVELVRVRGLPMVGHLQAKNGRRSNRSRLPVASTMPRTCLEQAEFQWNGHNGHTHINRIQ